MLPEIQTILFTMLDYYNLVNTLYKMSQLQTLIVERVITENHSHIIQNYLSSTVS